MAVSHLLPCPRAPLFPQGFWQPGWGWPGWPGPARPARAGASRAGLGLGLHRQGRPGLPGLGQARQVGLAWPIWLL